MSAPPRPILCVGDVMVDVLARLPGPIAIGSDAPAPVEVLGGGSAANTASWIAGAGAAVILAGRVGADPFGRQNIAELDHLGVRSALTLDTERMTGCCIVLVTPDGQRSMVPDSGANAALVPADLPDDLFAESAHLHLSGYTLLGGGHEAGLYALDAARAAGMTISVDAGSAAPIAAVGADIFRAWFPGDILMFANDDEARVLTGLDDLSEAARDLAKQFGRAVVKLGARGAIWAERGSDPVPVVTDPIEVIDTTGAGDAFAAGTLVSLSRGADPITAMRSGNGLAAAACRVIGGRCQPPAISSSHDRR